MQHHRYDQVRGADKGPGSVREGIAHLRSYEKIVIHPRCTHTLEEARLYAFKTDRLSGEILPDPVDKHNHCIDSLRYALEPLMGAGGDFEAWKRFFGEQARRDREADEPPPVKSSGAGPQSPPAPNFPNRPPPRPKSTAIDPGAELRALYALEYSRADREYGRPEGCASCAKPIQPGVSYVIEGPRQFHESCFREARRF